MSQESKTQKQAEYHPNELIFIQSRAEINLAVVEEYAEMMAEGIVFDPVEGVKDENGLIYVYDGYHRGEAAKQVGLPVLVNLQAGSRTEAEWLALTANQKHGLRRTNADKQRVVRQALLHPYGATLSNSELARHCGVNDKTVAKIRREMETSSEIPKIDKRMVRRNGVTYEQDTRNIGNSQGEPQNDSSQQAIPSIEQQDNLPSKSYNHNTINPGWSQSLNGVNELSESGTDIGAGGKEQSSYQLKSQEFECPRCGAEKIVGVNGSRRWCLHCLAEWPTAAAFLTEVKAHQGQLVERPTRQQLQARFLSILARLDEQDPQLGQISAWLDTLEAQLDLADMAEQVEKHQTIPTMESA
jgi:transposase-like protein